MSTALPLFTFYRTDEVIKSGSTIVGNRGILTVNGKQYFTIERDIARYVNIPEGLFTLQMENSASREVNGKARKQFRIIGHNVLNSQGKLANLLIHRGKSPSTLEGCIAPGKDKTNTGITQSDEAIEELIAACGVFEHLKIAATLNVASGPQTYHVESTSLKGANSSQSTESSTGKMSGLNELLNY